MIMIDKLAYSSKLRYKSPCLKAFVAVSSLLICVNLRSFYISIIIFLIMGGLTVFKGKTSLKYYIKIMMIPLGFLILSTLAIIFNISDRPLSIFAISFLGKYLTVSKDGFIYGINLILTALSAVSCLYFLSLSTPITDLLYVLEFIHCPVIIIELLLLIYRFIFILLDMLSSLHTSQKCRLGNKDFRTYLKGSSDLAATLFIRAFRKSSLLYDSMESRGYDGRLHLLKENIASSKKEKIIAIVFEVTLLILAYAFWRIK